MSATAPKAPELPANLQGLRLGCEAELFRELTQSSSVNRAIARIRSHFSGFGFGHRRHLLANAVRLTPRIAPELLQALEECRARLGIAEPIELFVAPMGSLNAYCHKPPVGPPIVVLSSMLIERFRPAEVKFILGHELGHALFDHASIPMPITSVVSDAAGRMVPLEMSLKLFKWSRAAEFSADRAGLACAGDLEAAVSTFFKLASGLNTPITLDHTKSFLAQINSLTLSPIARPRLDPQDEGADCFYTHPFSPLRVRALMRFAASDAYVGMTGKGVAEIKAEELERLTEADLRLMDPDYLQDKSAASELLREILFNAGLLLAHADGRVAAAELDALATLLGRERVDAPGTLALATEKLTGLFAKAKAQCSATDRARVIQHLVIIAFADGHVAPEETAFMESTAAALEVDPALVAQTLEASRAPMD